MKKVYTEEVKKFIFEIYKGKTAREIQMLVNKQFNLNITYTGIKSYLTSNKIKLGRNNVPSKYSKEQVDFLINNVKGITLKELREKFNERFNLNVSDNVIEYLKYKHGLRSGIVGGRFEKGMIPFNKGKKWDEFMSKEGQNNSRKTTFKKGNVPVNQKNIGYERINVDGYVEIKVAEPNVFKFKHRFLYEQKYGKIPKGYKLIFADGNKLNLEIDNLVLVSDSEELIMNRQKLFYKDKDLTKSGSNIAKLIDKLNKRKKDI